MTQPEPRQWKESMGEISGFGGGYEAVCRALVLAGLAWVDENPEAQLEAHSFENIYGIVVADNDNAKTLEKAMLDASVHHKGNSFRNEPVTTAPER